MLNGLDLFSGIGGIALALEPWVKPVAYCENDRYAQAVLLSRMYRGGLTCAPIWDDVRTLDGKSLPTIDIVYGGFPCQDISAAGAGRGLAGERSGLYLEIERLVRETKPTFVFLENVPAIRTRGLGRVVWGLSELGYDCRWTVVSAQEVGAPHIRKRWFLLAHANGMRLRQEQRPQHSKRKGQIQSNDTSPPQSVADTKNKHARLSGGEKTQVAEPGDRGPLADTLREGCGSARDAITREEISGRTLSEFAGPGWWAIEPNVGRVAHGVPQRVDRLRGLGNAVVPSQAKEAFMRLMGIANA